MEGGQGGGGEGRPGREQKAVIAAKISQQNCQLSMLLLARLHLPTLSIPELHASVAACVHAALWQLCGQQQQGAPSPAVQPQWHEPAEACSAPALHAQCLPASSSHPALKSAAHKVLCLGLESKQFLRARCSCFASSMSSSLIVSSCNSNQLLLRMCCAWHLVCAPACLAHALLA